MASKIVKRSRKNESPIWQYIDVNFERIDVDGKKEIVNKYRVTMENGKVCLQKPVY